VGINGPLRLLTSNPLAFVLVAVPLLYSIIIHEVAHGWVAYSMATRLPNGRRLSLNPIKHLDPIGTLMLFLFGWRTCPLNINNIPTVRNRADFRILAGIVANILFAVAALLFRRLFLISSPAYGHSRLLRVSNQYTLAA